MHPRSGHWHLIDYVIVRKRDRADVIITRAMRGATMWSDHRLIKSKMKVALKQPKRHQTQTIIRKLNVALLQDDAVRQRLEGKLESTLGNVVDPDSACSIETS